MELNKQDCENECPIGATNHARSSSKNIGLSLNESTNGEGRTRRERHLTVALLTTLSVIVALSFVIAFYKVKSTNQLDELDGPETELQIYNSKEEIPYSEALVRKKQAKLITFRKIDEKKICLTKGCVTAAAALIQRMNSSVDPCDDAYEFACGNFIRDSILPEAGVRVDILTLIGGDLLYKLRMAFEEPISDKDSRPTILVKDLYASCINIDAINEMGLEPLFKIINELGGWPVLEGENWNANNFSWIDTMYTERRLGLTFNAIFELDIVINLQNSTERMIWIGQPAFGLSRQLLIRGSNDTAVQAYLDYSIDVAELLGADRLRAEEEMKEILELQLKMAQISSTQEELRSIANIMNVRSLKEMKELAPEIPWVDYINTVLNNSIKVNETEKINLFDIKYISNFTKLITQTPPRVLANYIIWRAVMSTIPYLSEDIRNLAFRFARKLRGQTSLPARFRECIEIVSGSFDYAVGNLYVKNYFDEKSKAQIDDLVMFLRRSFEYLLKRVEWMDDSTRQEALAKLKAMKAYIAFADELLDDQILTDYYAKQYIGRNESLLNNILSVSLFKTNYIGSQYRDRINHTSWENRPPAAIVNAFYSFDQNSLEFPAGILQGHFFQADRPTYMNYGAIGYVIGHEITHGFDDQGRNFDAKGNVRNWWEPKTEERFKERAQCMIDQYTSYVDPEIGMNLNGQNTIGENIADNGGIKASYQAYQNWVRINGQEEMLPGLDYTPNQLFWITSAQAWCSKTRPEYLRQYILTNVHSPPRFRIIGTFTNLKEFSKDFKCPLGSRMNPRKKCEVW